LPTSAEKRKTEALFASPQKRNLVLCLLIAVVTLALYNPVNQHPFVNYDDDRYVTENPQVRAGLTWETFKWALTATDAANWHPLTWLSHALDVQLFRMNPAGHHFTSLVLHALNAALLFLLLVLGTGRTGPSLFVAALFALHPINVESVAWVAERKSVLSTFFFLATIGAYGRYALKPNWQRYLAVATLFALGLMSKPMVITLPCVLLLLDYWPLGRIKGQSVPPLILPTQPRPIPKLLLEKLPLLALSAASAAITMQAQQSGGAVRSTVQFSLGVRLQNAMVAYSTYVWKAFWPARLAPLYPHPGESLPAWQVAVSLLFLIGVTVLTLRWRSRRYLLVGWLWFLGTLVPVIGLIQVGEAAMADRYAYIPLIGIFVMVACGTADLADSWRLGLPWRIIPAVCVLLALSLAMRQQLSYWSSSLELWSHALAVTEENFVAQDNLGGALVLLGKTEEAYPHFQAAAAINPRDPMGHSNLGAYLQEHGRLQEAVTQYQTTISLTSDHGLLANTYANLGSAYRQLGDDDKALTSYEEALRLNTNQFNAYLGLGLLQQKQGKLPEAIANFSKSVELRPTDEGYLLLGRALEQAGRPREAISAYQEALRISPGMKEAEQGLDALTGERR
jgi:protein O-mannosyl-transferase